MESNAQSNLHTNLNSTRVKAWANLIKTQKKKTIWIVINILREWQPRVRQFNNHRCSLNGTKPTRPKAK